MTHDAGHGDEDDFDADGPGEPDDGIDGEFDGDGHAEEARAHAVERLGSLVGEAQGRLSEAGLGDLDPCEPYRLAFRALGLPEGEVEAAVAGEAADMAGRLHDLVGSGAYAAIVLREALARFEIHAVDAAWSPGPR